MLYATARCRLHPTDAALAIIQRSYGQRRKTLPAHHPLIAAAGLRVAACLYQLRRYDAAEAELLNDIRELEAVRSPGFRRNQEGYALLRDVYLAIGRRTEAERWSARIESGS
jgi:intracellular sulfur oxidation DsrE/DsrF family protein